MGALREIERRFTSIELLTGLNRIMPESFPPPTSAIASPIAAQLLQTTRCYPSVSVSLRPRERHDVHAVQAELEACALVNNTSL